MGYYVHIEDANCKLPAKHYDVAYWRMCELNKRDELKRGGSYSKNEDGTENVTKWFSWMEENYPETCKTALEILEELGFEVEDQEDGLAIYGYDNKSGQEELFLASISDLLVTVDGMYDSGNKPFIVWRGEDDMVWKDIYGKKIVEQLNGRVVFEESEIGG